MRQTNSNCKAVNFKSKPFSPFIHKILMLIHPGACMWPPPSTSWASGKASVGGELLQTCLLVSLQWDVGYTLWFSKKHRIKTECCCSCEGSERILWSPSEYVVCQKYKTWSLSLPWGARPGLSEQWPATQKCCRSMTSSWLLLMSYWKGTKRSTLSSGKMRPYLCHWALKSLNHDLLIFCLCVFV